MKIIGTTLFVLGLGSADSDNLAFPLLLVGLGMLLMWVSNLNKENDR